MPDRVIDAPIPDEELAQRLIRNTKGWMQERIAQLESLIESGDNPDGALIYRSDHDKIVARLEAEKQEAHTEGWNAVIEKLPPFNKMVWVAAPMWVIGKDGSKEYSPFCDVACLKDGPVRVWMTPNFEGYTFDEITHWRPLPVLSKPTAAKQGENPE